MIMTPFQQNVSLFLSAHGLVALNAPQDVVAGVLQNSATVLKAIRQPNEPLVATALRFRDVLEGEGVPPKVVEARRLLTHAIDRGADQLTAQTLQRAIEMVAENMMQGGVRPFSLPPTRQKDIPFHDMVNLPRNPTENDINAVGLLLPAGFRVAFDQGDQGKIVMTVLGGGDFSVPLFTYEIAPETRRNYEGTLLSLLLVDLAKKAAGALRNASFASSQTFNDIMDVVLPPAQSAIGQHCPNNEFSVRIGKILTTDADDWKIS